MKQRRVERPLVIYHGQCDDGISAAWVLYKYFKGDLDLHPATYSDRLGPLVAGRDVIMLDYAYSRQEMLRMMIESNTFVLLDHHTTNRDKLEGIEEEAKSLGNPNVELYFDMDKSAARITWNRYFPADAVPMLITHVEDKDLDLERHKNTVFYIRSLRSKPYTVESINSVVEFTEDDLGYMLAIKEGMVIDRFFTQQMSLMRDRTEMSVRIMGVHGLCSNVSQVFAEEAALSLAKKSGTFGAGYYITSDYRVRFSLRSKAGIDVAIIAEHFGGGGRARAAGFEIDFKELGKVLSGGT